MNYFWARIPLMNAQPKASTRPEYHKRSEMSPPRHDANSISPTQPNPESPLRARIQALVKSRPAAATTHPAPATGPDWSLPIHNLRLDYMPAIFDPRCASPCPSPPRALPSPTCPTIPRRELESARVRPTLPFVYGFLPGPLQCKALAVFATSTFHTTE